MAEVDIDKLLAKQEKKEEDDKKKALFKKGLIFAGVGAAVIITIIAVVIIMLGESSAAYFPLENTSKYVYNKKNRSPEEWQVQAKTARVGDFDCKVMNKMDMENHSLIQEYYVAGKKGIIMLAVSKDYGPKKESKMRLLPARLKKGLLFDSGTLKNTAITGTIAEIEELSTPVGDCKVYRVEYRAGNYLNRDVWYGKAVGVIKYNDKITGDQLDLVSRVEK
jgi:hypothetical protein